jgi:hypothetical protein
MGYMNINGLRYFDTREINKIWYPIIAKGASSLPSDSLKRADSVTLKAGDDEKAQVEKEAIENLQRHDRSLREAAEARRKAGGPKIVY